jgi:hypothetical protein
MMRDFSGSPRAQTYNMVVNAGEKRLRKIQQDLDTRTKSIISVWQASYNQHFTTYPDFRSWPAR